MENFCTNCGAPLSPEDDFCKACGEPVGAKKRKNILPVNPLVLWGSLGIILVVIISVFLFNWLTGSDEFASFQLITGEDTYLYHDQKLYEIEEVASIHYNQSFIYKNYAVLYSDYMVQIVNLKTEEVEDYDNISGYTFSEEEGIIAFLEEDELIRVKVTKPDEDVVIAEEVRSYQANKGFSKFYVLSEEGELAQYNHKGELEKEDLADSDEVAYGFEVIQDRYLVFFDGDTVILDLKEEEEIERYRDQGFRQIVVAENEASFLIILEEMVVAFSQGEIEEYDQQSLFSEAFDGYTAAVIYTFKEDVSVFNLEALTSDFEDIDFDWDEELNLRNVQDGSGLLVYEDGEKDLIVYTYQKGKSVPKEVEIELEEKVSWLEISNDHALVYYDDDEVYFYNGTEEFELEMDQEEIEHYHFTREDGLYYRSLDKLYYITKKGESHEVYDDETITATSYNIFTNQLFLLNEDEDLFLIEGNKISLVAEDVTMMTMANGQVFYMDDDELYIYLDGESIFVEEDVFVQSYDRHMDYYK